jgi:hypothetical protein
LVFLPPRNPFSLPHIFQSLSDQWWISNARDNLDPVNGSACVDVDPIHHSYLIFKARALPAPLVITRAAALAQRAPRRWRRLFCAIELQTRPL